MDLPEPGTPLQLADGRKIDPNTGKTIREEAYVSVPRHSEAQELIAGTRKKLVDLPDVPEKMNIISVVAAYHLYGLESAEIAVALQVSEEQIERIRSLDTFTEFLREIMNGISERDSDRVRRAITNGQEAAVSRVVSLVNSDDDQVSLAASRDLLDRGGHRPVDVVEHRHSMDGELVIRHVDARNEDALRGVTIDAASERSE